jgi:hypothetical protein
LPVFRSIGEHVISLMASFIGLILSFQPFLYPKLLERLSFHAIGRRKMGAFVTVVVRPKRLPEIEGIYVPPKTAIIVQGQLLGADDFTLESLRWYRQLYPQCEIILSTWQGEDAERLRCARDMGVRVVLAEKPQVAGVLNFNMQLATTAKALEAAREVGAQFVLKTRTDQRVGDRYALSFLHALLKSFPSASGLDCRGRIFLLGDTSLVNIPFHVCDMLQFGFLEDVQKFWTVEADRDTLTRPQLLDQIAAGEWTAVCALNRRPMLPEIKLGTAYAHKMFGPEILDNPGAGYARLVGEALGFVTRTQIDMFWPKYHAYEFIPDYRRQSTAHESFTFEKWLCACN